jgi:hypothetical protein
MFVILSAAKNLLEFREILRRPTLRVGARRDDSRTFRISSYSKAGMTVSSSAKTESTAFSSCLEYLVGQI